MVIEKHFNNDFLTKMRIIGRGFNHEYDVACLNLTECPMEHSSNIFATENLCLPEDLKKVLINQAFKGLKKYGKVLRNNSTDYREYAKEELADFIAYFLASESQYRDCLLDLLESTDKSLRQLIGS